MSVKVRLYLEGLALWLEEPDARALRAELARRTGNGEVQPLDQEALTRFLAGIPKRKNQVIDAVLNVAASANLVEQTGPNRFKLRRALEKDPTFARLLAG